MEFAETESRSHKGIWFVIVPLLLILGASIYAFRPVISKVSGGHDVGDETSIENHIAKAQFLKSNCLAIEKDIIILMDPSFIAQLDKNVDALSVETQLLEKLAKQTGDVNAAKKASDFKVYIEDYSDWLAELTKTFEALGINIKPYLQGDVKKVALSQGDIRG